MSPAAEPKQERARRTRQALLRAAAEAFAENGYQATSMNDIAARAEMAKGALTFHFPSKAAVAAAVIESFYDRWPPVAQRLRAEHASPLETVWSLLSHLAGGFREDALVRAAVRLQGETNLIDAPLPAPYRDWTDLLAGLYGEAEAAGELRPGIDPAELARITVAAFFGVQHISQAQTGRADLGERVEELLRLLRPAVTASG
ncbi:ScbR family autoregulator-binding transcription factor [Nonomuraea sp. NPDC049695]|uniref:ScbR family autoregulator-binding transcription factor n=1 Tax=Nonomuraea sp. NPDC049695 TaxID=3154734 RepID=UPI0034433D49